MVMSLFIFISQIIENCVECFPDETEDVTEIVELVKNTLPQLEPKEITKDAEETATLKDEKGPMSMSTFSNECGFLTIVLEWKEPSKNSTLGLLLISRFDYQ
ncbi:hypothetical protein RJT34_03532 [Clitoria ternatea]|uniref:Uncharacterized protein n=1 Tax=Clitoria ternatea TaxID=43366 RepID=A0AAN9KJL3_CLITE